MKSESESEMDVSVDQTNIEFDNAEDSEGNDTQERHALDEDPSDDEVVNVNPKLAKKKLHQSIIQAKAAGKKLKTESTENVPIKSKKPKRAEAESMAPTPLIKKGRKNLVGIEKKQKKIGKVDQKKLQEVGKKVLRERSQVKVVAKKEIKASKKKK